jgi:hypothetical protein
MPTGWARFIPSDFATYVAKRDTGMCQERENGLKVYQIQEK